MSTLCLSRVRWLWRTSRRTVRFDEIGRVFERRLPRTEEELFRRRPVAHWLATNQVWRTPCSAFLKWHFLTPANLEHQTSSVVNGLSKYPAAVPKSSTKPAYSSKQVSSILSKFDQGEASSNVTEAFCYQESLISTINLEHQISQSTKIAGLTKSKAAFSSKS